MTRDELIETALQCGVWIPMAQGQEREQTIDRLQRFVGRAVAAEREACAQTCEALRGTVSMFATSKDCRTHNNAITGCVKAISTRGEK